MPQPSVSWEGRGARGLTACRTLPPVTCKDGGGSSIRMETPLPSAWRCPFHPHRLTHPFQVVPGVYGVALFAFLLRLDPLAFLSSLLTR